MSKSMTNQETLMIVDNASQGHPAKSPEEYRGDYGNLFMPPFPEAESFLSSMTKDERLNFNQLLRRFQEWYEPEAGRPITFHPETSAAYWGQALAKIADHYRDVEDDMRAIFFFTSAWNISKYPVFAYKAGMLSIHAAEETAAGLCLLESYLAEYGNANVL
jgi:hypothetical protein